MNMMKIGKVSASIACAGGLLFAGMFLVSQSGKAQSAQVPGPFDAALVEKGIEISPVTLNLQGKDRNKVGYGSYLVNAIGGCNDCHTGPNWAEGGDPFLGQPKKINVAGYLAGGVAFGPFISRNITPDSTGKVAGGLANFKEILKTGKDFKQLHPQISPLLQVMPWPVHQNLVDRDIEAIYEFLSSIPCLEGGPGEPAKRCQAPIPTAAVALPKNADVIQPDMFLDGTKSTSADGKDLQYAWSIPAGYPQAAILQGNSATPIVQFPRAYGVYAFDLTVTDSKGKTSTDRATVLYQGR